MIRGIRISLCATSKPVDKQKMAKKDKDSEWNESHGL